MVWDVCRWWPENVPGLHRLVSPGPSERKGGSAYKLISPIIAWSKVRNHTLAIVLTTVVNFLSGRRYVELMVSIWEMVVLIPPTTPIACCATEGTSLAESSSFGAASILARRFSQKIAQNTDKIRLSIYHTSWAGAAWVDLCYKSCGCKELTRAASFTPWKAWNSSIWTDVLTPMEKLAILWLDQLGSKFFNLTIFPILISSDPSNVETIAGV